MKTPEFGLVCITHSAAIRYRTLTLTRDKYFPVGTPARVLDEIYQYNLRMLHKAIEFCAQHRFALYRIPSDIFPMSNLPDEIGLMALEKIRKDLTWVGRQAAKQRVRLVIHPDHFVVLNSASAVLIENSSQVLEHQAKILDWMGLPKSPWAAINIHAGNSGRAEQLIETILHLPHNVRSRLTLENDERAYGAGEILEVCQKAGIPMVFDVQHHVVRERLPSFEDPSIGLFVEAAGRTWPQPEWQIVHLSNGRSALHDPAYHNQVTMVPSSFRDLPWIEVEAKQKEYAIAQLRSQWNQSAAMNHPLEAPPVYLGGAAAVE